MLIHPMTKNLDSLISETVQKTVDFINDNVKSKPKIIRIFQPIFNSNQVLLICVDHHNKREITPEMIPIDTIRILNDTMTLLPRQGLLDHFIKKDGTIPYRQALRDMTEDVYALIDRTQPIDKNTTGDWFILQPYVHDQNQGHMITAVIDWSTENLEFQYGLTQHSYVLPMVNDYGALDGL